MAVDVVVVNYHTDELLYDFIESYEKSWFEGCTLTVVDVEGGRDMVDTTIPASLWITTSQNIGYARACNLGAEKGKNDVILLANADTLLEPDAFSQCYGALEHFAEWGILGPRQVDDNNRITAGGIFGTETNIGQRGWQEYDHGQYSDIRDDAKSVSGSLYFIKRSVWQELTDCPYMQQYSPGIKGAFIETPHYYEETACSYHARAHGYKIVFYGPARMVHLWHRASPHGGRADQQVETSKAMMRDFCRQHGIICE